MSPGLLLLLSVLWVPVRPHTDWISPTGTGTPPSVTPGPNRNRTDIAPEPGGSGVLGTPRGHWSQSEPGTHHPTEPGTVGIHRGSEPPGTLSQSDPVGSGTPDSVGPWGPGETVTSWTHRPEGFKESGTEISWRKSAKQLMAPGSEPTWNKEPNGIPSRSGDIAETPPTGSVKPKAAQMDQPEPRTETQIVTSGSEPGGTGQNHLLTHWESPSATEIVHKSVTRRQVNKRGPHAGTTMYHSATFTRTLLSVTKPDGSADITEIPGAYDTATEPRSLRNQAGQLGTTRHYSGTATWGNTTQDSHKVTLQDFGNTTSFGNWSQNAETIPGPNSGTSTQESANVTKNTITAHDSEITISGLITSKSSNSSLLSTSEARESDSPTMAPVITTQIVLTASYSGTSGTYPLLTPSYGASTVLSPTAHHVSDTSGPLSSLPVTAPDTTEVPANYPSTWVSSTSNWPSPSDPSLLQSEPSSSTLSPSASSAELGSSPVQETSTHFTKFSSPSSPDIFSSSPMPPQQLSSSSLPPSPPEIPSVAFSSTSSISLSPMSTLPTSRPASSSAAVGTEGTGILLTTLETTNQFSEFTTAATSSVTGLIHQTIQPHRTSSDSATTVLVRTDSREVTHNPTVSAAEDILVETSKPVDGSEWTTSTDKQQTFVVTPEPSAQPTDPSTTTSSDLLLPPVRPTTQGLPQPEVHTTKSSDFHFTTNDPNRQIATLKTTELNPKTFGPGTDLGTSPVGTTERIADQTVTQSHVQKGGSITTTATTKAPVITAPRATSPAKKGGRCLSNPCQNGGRCVELGHANYKCECPPAWQGEHCGTDVDECLAEPCPPQTSCVNKGGSFSCRCPLGSFLEKESGCVLARTFLGHIKVPRNFLNGTMGRYSDVGQIEEVIVHMLNRSFSGLSGYYLSEVTNSSDTNHILISVQNLFSLGSNVTKKEIKQNLQNYMRWCQSALESTPGCHLMLHPQLYYIADGLCSVSPPECDQETTDCSDVTGVPLCQCKPGYFKYTNMDHSCKACEDGFQRVNGSCARCPFGLGGFNCSNPYQLITVIIAAAGGGLLLLLGVALTVTCCRKNKNDLSKLIFKSGDFQMSPYAECGKNPPRPPDWGRETIEMQENGSTKNLLQINDVYYSPGLRNPELDRNGLYPYTGLPGSRHSCIYPGQYNPSFISEENRRRDYF